MTEASYKDAEQEIAHEQDGHAEKLVSSGIELVIRRRKKQRK